MKKNFLFSLSSHSPNIASMMQPTSELHLSLYIDSPEYICTTIYTPTNDTTKHYIIIAYKYHTKPEDEQQTNELYDIYKYNINTDTCIGISQYPMHFNPEHLKTITIDKNTLYLFSDNKLLQLNVETGEWAKEITPNKLIINDQPIHVIENNAYLWHRYSKYIKSFNILNNTCINLPQIASRWNNKPIGSLTNSSLIYISELNQFMVLNEYNDGYIFYCDIASNNWKLFELKMPFRRAKGQYYNVLVLQYFIFVLYYKCNSNQFEIFCVDLMETNKVWYKSCVELDDQFLDDISETLFVKPFVANNEINLISYTSYLAIHLDDVIPYQKIVFGYLREMESMCNISIINEVKMIIFEFTPYFLS
eukprot:145434_1